MARNSVRARKNAVPDTPPEHLTGHIEHVIYPGWGKESKNGFAILKINLSRESRIPKTEATNDYFDEMNNLITAKGTMPHPRTGDELKLTGHWVNDSNYGRQFAFTTFDIILPTSQQGVIAYFSSDKFFGLGRVAAEKILAALGDNCLNILKENPQAAFNVPGLSEKQQAELAEKMGEHNALGDLIALVCRHGIGTSMAGKIYARYGPKALDVVKENPYQLITDVDGIGFDKADKIGAAVGIKSNSDFRIEAAIRHVLEEVKSEGHCALRSALVTESVLKLLGAGSGVNFGDVARLGRGMIEAAELFREKDSDQNIDLIYLAEMHGAEYGLARKIKRCLGDMPGIDVDMVKVMVAVMEKEMGNNFALAPEQNQAVITALTKSLSVITGGPGTGKSTITKFIVSGYESLNAHNEILLCAPTGRAAKRLKEATGREAKTIHRLLKYNPEAGFEYNEYNQLPGPGLLIIDEASMMDVELAYNLFAAVPGDMQVVVIGDINQLPSVGTGAVLRDIIHSGVVPVTKLRYVYRQEAGSTISLIADMINNYDRDKKMPDLAELSNSIGAQNGDFLFVHVESAEDAREAVRAGITGVHTRGMSPADFQVLTPLKDRGQASAKVLNDVIREIVNPARDGLPEKKYGDKLFRDGDKAMWTRKNNYKKMLFNGDIGMLTVGEHGGVVFDVDGSGVLLDGDDFANLELAYSFTVHKAQGGESPFVPVICIKSHYIMLTRSLLYTAITRAKKKLVIVGTQEAFEIAVKSNKVERRFGLLKERLRGEIGD